MLWRRETSIGDDPVDILKRRYAQGELSREEYEQMRRSSPPEQRSRLAQLRHTASAVATARGGVDVARDGVRLGHCKRWPDRHRTGELARSPRLRFVLTRSPPDAPLSRPLSVWQPAQERA